MMKKYTVIGLALLLALTMFGCSDSTENATPSDSGATTNSAGGEERTTGAEPVNIMFYTYNYAPGAGKEALDQLISEFEAENKDITVTPVFVQSTELSKKVQEDLAAGVTPDVVQLFYTDVEYAVNNFGIQDLSTIAGSDELTDHLAGFEPSMVNAAKQEGKLYSIPYSLSLSALFYNEKLFVQAGLDPETPPATWDQVEEYALQIKDKTGMDGFVFGGTGHVAYLQQIIKNKGGDIISPDRKILKFGEQPAIDAISMLSEMYKSGALSNMSENQGFQAFSQGKLGMMVYTTNMYILPNTDDLQLRLTDTPTFDGGKVLPILNGTGLNIFSKDSAKQQASWKFIKYVTSEHGETVIAEKLAYPPLRPALLTDENYCKDWAETDKNLEMIQVVYPQLENLIPCVTFPGGNSQQIRTTFLDAVNKSIFSDVDVTKTMNEAQSQAQAFMP
jgi:multiple sugar transport system substrate-binding protein